MNAVIEKGFTMAEWEALKRLNELDPQEAVKRFLSGISDPYERKSKYPMFKPDKREYNLGVMIYETGHFMHSIDYFEGIMANTERSENGIIRFGLAGRRGKVRPKINLYVRFFCTSKDPLNPVAANDRTSGEYPYIQPGDTYEGFVYFPYLASWLRSGKRVRLLGV